jgi:chorismate lyase / 3-hydroxybenzoate synthase
MNTARLTIQYCPNIDPPTVAGSLGFQIMGLPVLPGAVAGHIISSRLLDPQLPVLVEQWLTSEPVSVCKEGNLIARYDGQLLMGVLHLDESQFAATAQQSPLELAAASAYQQLFDLIDSLGYPHLWRAWNFIPNINQVTLGIERYRQFNQGRQFGFATRTRPTEGNVPAACAVGTREGVLSVGFLAGRTQTIAIENPRQISAFDYPSQYGAKAPTFSRAALGNITGQELFLLSGTASIVGHETMHAGNVMAQTTETINNIEAVIEQANRQRTRARPYGLQDFAWRVFVRHETELAAIQSVLVSRINANPIVPPVYLHMDICRDDLLVEIEGIAW